MVNLSVAIALLSKSYLCDRSWGKSYNWQSHLVRTTLSSNLQTRRSPPSDRAFGQFPQVLVLVSVVIMIHHHQGDQSIDFLTGCADCWLKIANIA
ncbi:hypothetical protein [Synechococcus sp. PCC 7502]|uniref:hypothetical protein n=1 Tax=Synechococcus sp. PCC 7502 TaxID=1173263 RepID=UPI0002E54B36|nr:hypothetical protein [Synechococcus sp. PCC 7502]